MVHHTTSPSLGPSCAVLSTAFAGPSGCCGPASTRLICRGHALARKLGLRISSHTAAGTFSIEKGFLKHLRETGRTDVRYLMNLGVLDATWLLIHGIHCTDLDLEHIAHVGASLVYTPTSEAMRGGGIGPIANAQAAGVK